MSGAWVQLRGVLVALHVLAVVTMSVPSPEGMSAALLERKAGMLRPWQDAAARVGIPPEATATIVLGGGRALEAVEDGAERVFAPYVGLCGVAQSWRMFATSPARGLRVEMWVYAGSRWRKVYGSLDPDARWRAGMWEQGRVRGLLRALALDESPAWWNALAESAARRAARDFPEAETFRLHRVPVRLPPPERLAVDPSLRPLAPVGQVDLPLAPLREDR